MVDSPENKLPSLGAFQKAPGIKDTFMAYGSFRLGSYKFGVFLFCFV